MAQHKSALKRIKQNERRRLRNRYVMSTMRSRIRLLREVVAAGKKDEAEAKLRETIGRLNRAASKGVIPKKRAARITSRLSRLVNGLA